MGGRDSPKVSPVVAERGKAHGPVKEELVGGFLDGAVGEGGARQNLLCSLRVAGDDEAGESEGERHEVVSSEGARQGGEVSMCGEAGRSEEDSRGAGNCRSRTGEKPSEATGEEEEGSCEHDGGGECRRKCRGEKDEDVLCVHIGEL